MVSYTPFMRLILEPGKIEVRRYILTTFTVRFFYDDKY